MIPGPLPLSEVTLAVLAGGEGSRMGRPKGLLRIGDRSILEFLLDQFAWPGPTMLVTAPGREKPPGRERFGEECVDPVAGQGPLRGVLTALEHASTERVAVVTVDMPGMGREPVEHMVATIGPGDSGAMYRRARESAIAGQIVEPFPLFIHKNTTETIRARIAAGMLSVVRLQEEPGFTVCDAPQTWEKGVWVNLNRPQDLESFLASTGEATCRPPSPAV